MQKSCLQVRTDLTELGQVLFWFNQLTQSFLPRATLIQCQTLLAEGFTNAVRHAHKERSPETPIDIEVSISEQQLEMRIWDYGLPFNLEQKLKSLSGRVDLDSLGGRGLKLLEGMADQLSYTCGDGDRNCLLIVKHYSDLRNCL